MNLSNAAAMVTVIAAVSAALVAIINAIAAGWGRQEARASAAAVRDRLVAEAAHIKDTLAANTQATTQQLDRQDGKLDVIHDLTNSNMTALKAQLAEALARIKALEASRQH